MEAPTTGLPVAFCRDYVKRLQQLGKHVQLTEYAGANHSFDNPLSPVHDDAHAAAEAMQAVE